MTVRAKTIVRFPPSPTGYFHIGGVRTALYNYLFAKQNNGKFLLRIEDTDKERSKKEYEADILDSLSWLGLKYDNQDAIWRQSERTPIYKEKIKELIEKGAAYLAEAQAGEASDGKQVVRFKNPGGKVTFQDFIRGEVVIEVSDLGDFVIAKNMDEPLYHLTVVVDDLESNVTHVIRGEDHISNTPRQILILEALGGRRPTYAHLPLVLAEDKSKLSKRKHGESVSLKYYREKGYEPEAIINFMALIGWNPGTEQEIFTLEELIKVFSLDKVQKKGAIFNIKKLNWLNKEYLKLKKDETEKVIADKLKQKFTNQNIHPKLTELLFEKIEVISDIDTLITDGGLDYFSEKPSLEKEKIAWKTQNLDEAKKSLEKVLELGLEKEKIMEYAERVGKGNVLWPLRYALSGKEKSPDPFTLIEILGIEESKQRIQYAIQI